MTDEPWGGQPKPCMSDGGITCGVWIYCLEPSGHDGLHGGWAANYAGRETHDSPILRGEATWARWGD